MGIDFHTEYRYVAPTGETIYFVEYDFNVSKTYGGKASILGGYGHEMHSVSKEDFDAAKQMLSDSVRPAYASNDSYMDYLRKEGVID